MAMTKIFDLGATVENTGEPRVQLIESSLIKTASSEIQRAWDSITTDTDKFAYLWVIACGAHETYGCNNNGDSWTEADLKKTHHLFTSSAHVFLYHVNKDPAKSLGVPVFSHYNQNMHRIELILKLDKSLEMAKDTVAKIKAGVPITVSIGAHQEYDVCSICGKQSKKREDYCEHLKYNLKKILPDGRQVFAMNPNPRWFDISIVRKPAFSPAFALDKAASLGAVAQDSEVVSSAFVGEQEIDTQTKLAALKKFSYIVKRVNGTVTDAKDGKDSVNVLKSLRDSGNLDKVMYPQLSSSEMDGLGISPGGLVRAMYASGAPLSIGECVHICGRHCLGSAYSPETSPAEFYDKLPTALQVLGRRPEAIEPLIHSVLGDYHEELDDPAVRARVVKIVVPVANARNILIKIANEREFEKVAAEVSRIFPPTKTTGIAPLDVGEPYTSAPRAWARDLLPLGPSKFDKIEFKGPDGEDLYTTRWHAEQAHSLDSIPRIALGSIPKWILIAAAFGAAMSDIPLTQKMLLFPSLLVAAKAISSKSPPSTTVSGVENLPMSTMFYEAKAGLDKSASSITAPLYGMAIPTALAADYTYNYFRAKNDPSVVEDMSPTQRNLVRAGYYVHQHPMTSLAGGAIAGGVASGIADKVFRKPQVITPNLTRLGKLLLLKK